LKTVVDDTERGRAFWDLKLITAYDGDACECLHLFDRGVHITLAIDLDNLDFEYEYVSHTIGGVENALALPEAIL
jgi:hypothetical protein